MPLPTACKRVFDIKEESVSNKRRQWPKIVAFCPGCKALRTRGLELMQARVRLRIHAVSTILADQVTASCDFIAIAEGGSLTHIGDMVNLKTKSTDGVARAVTCAMR